MRAPNTPTASLLRQAAVLTLLGPAALQAQAIGFTDGDFDTTQWQQVVVAQAGVSTLSFTRFDDPGFGNPGAYWSHLFQRPATTTTDSSDTRVANIFTGFSYDPAVSGAPAAFDFSLDLRGVSTSFTFANTGSIRPALLQGGVVYTVAGTDKQSLLGPWTSASWHFDATTPWIAGSGTDTPDFSASGAPIQFGYRFGLATSCAGASGCRAGNAFSAIDNFHVDVTSAAPVPEPGALALALAGLLVVGQMARRRLMAAPDA